MKPTTKVDLKTWNLLTAIEAAKKQHVATTAGQPDQPTPGDKIATLEKQLANAKKQVAEVQATIEATPKLAAAKVKEAEQRFMALNKKPDGEHNPAKVKAAHKEWARLRRNANAKTYAVELSKALKLATDYAAALETELAAAKTKLTAGTKAK